MRMPIRRVVVTNVDDRVEFDEQEISSEEDKITLWKSESPSSAFVLIKWPAGTWIDFHNPPAINYMYLIDGQVEYAAKNGGKVRLKAGDCMVAREIDHGWRTPPDSHATLLAVAVDTQRTRR